MVTNLELAIRLQNWGTGEWIRRLRLMTEDERRREMLRISADCIEALDEIQRLERSAPEPSGEQSKHFAGNDGQAKHLNRRGES